VPELLLDALALLLDALALLLDALAVPDPPAPLLLDALAPPPDPPVPLLPDAPPPLPDAEAETEEEPPPAALVVPPVVEGAVSPQPTPTEEIPVRTETTAKHDARRGTRGMLGIVPPSPDPPART
jgi:hypothetical protein